MVILVVILWHWPINIQISLDGIIECSHSRYCSLKGCEIEHEFKLGNLGRMQCLEFSHLAASLLVSACHQCSIIRAIIEYLIQSEDRKCLIPPIQCKLFPINISHQL